MDDVSFCEGLLRGGGCLWVGCWVKNPQRVAYTRVLLIYRDHIKRGGGYFARDEIGIGRLLGKKKSKVHLLPPSHVVRWHKNVRTCVLCKMFGPVL